MIPFQLKILIFCTTHQYLRLYEFTSFQAGLNEDYTCTCSLGFHGPHCEFSSDICTKDNPCENGATCLSNMSAFINDYSCVCQKGFIGRNCESNYDESDIEENHTK